MLKNIAIIMGGYSSEYQISLKSGSMVYDTLDRYKYTPYAIHIFKNKWVCVHENGEETPVNKDDFSILIDGKKLTFHCVFLHHFHGHKPICF